MAAQESTLDKIRTRPRFRLATHATKAAFAENLKNYVALHHDEYEAVAHSEGAMVRIKNDNYTYWKPQLTLTTHEEDGQTVVKGVFGPASSVWTFFMFLYFAFGILWMVFVTLWFVGLQIKVDSFSWALPVSFLMLLAIFGIYFVARIGQKKASEEMAKLRNFAEDCILRFES